MLRVFICDENFLFMNYLNNKITKWVNCRSELIDSSDLLLKHLDKTSPDILFINEKHLNNIGLTQLKSQLPNTNIIVLLENASLLDGNKYLSLGATDIMTKASINSIAADRFFEQKIGTAWVA